MSESLIGEPGFSETSQCRSDPGRGVLALGVALYIVFACLFAFGTPLMSGPDEGAHAVYIRVLATQYRLPHIGPPGPYSDAATDTHQAQHPPGYYLLCAPLYRLLDALNVAPWLGLRLLSVLIGAASVVVVWCIGRVLFPESPFAVALCATAGLVPTFQYMMAMINNIGLAILLLALAGHRLALIARGPDTRRQWVILGLLLGLGSLTSLMNLALCIVPLVLLASRLRVLGPRESLIRFGAVVGAPVIFVGWWLARNYVMYGTPTPMFQGVPMAPLGLLALLVSLPLDFLVSVGLVLNNGLVQLSSCEWLMRETGIPRSVVVVAYIIAYASFVLFLAGVVRARRAADEALRSWGPLAMLAFVVIYAGLLRQVWYVDLQVGKFVGRYFIILIPFCLPLAAWALAALKPRRPSATVCLAVLCAFLLVANAAHTAYVIWFFHRP